MSKNVDTLMNQIESLEKEIKKRHPKQKGRVLLANAKTKVDYELGKDAHFLQWNRQYRDELERILR